jgi:hypothetical protein
MTGKLLGKEKSGGVSSGPLFSSSSQPRLHFAGLGSVPNSSTTKDTKVHEGANGGILLCTFVRFIRKSGHEPKLLCMAAPAGLL